MDISISIIVIALLICVREGFQNRDRIDWNKSINRMWHIYGFVMRFLLVGLMYMITENWIYTASVAVIVWPFYNISCAIGLRKKWYYVGKDGTDWLIRKVFFFINFDK